jgi:hypothetical protein
MEMTVFNEILSRTATSLFDFPSATSCSTSLWRAGASSGERAIPGHARSSISVDHVDIISPPSSIAAQLTQLGKQFRETNLRFLQDGRASVLAEQGHGSEAKRLFQNAAQEEKYLGHREPPAYIRPVAETEEAVMMAIGNWSDANAVYQTALIEWPRSGFALYGIAMCSEKSGDSKASAREYADFLTAWKSADPGLSQIKHAQAYIAKHDVSRSGS